LFRRRLILCLVREGHPASPPPPASRRAPGRRRLSAPVPIPPGCLPQPPPYVRRPTRRVAKQPIAVAFRPADETGTVFLLFRSISCKKWYSLAGPRSGGVEVPGSAPAAAPAEPPGPGRRPPAQRGGPTRWLHRAAMPPDPRVRRQRPLGGRSFGGGEWLAIFGGDPQAFFRLVTSPGREGGPAEGRIFF